MDRKGVLLVLGTAVISGFSVWLNSYGVKGLDAAFFTTAKNVLVAIFLLATLLALKEWSTIAALSKKTWAKLALIGLVGGSVPFVLFFTGLKMSTAAASSAVRASMLIWVALLAMLFLKEKVTKGIALSAILLLAGSALLIKLQGLTLGKGELLILAATVLWAGETVLSKHLLKDAISGRIVALARMGFGAIFLLAYLGMTGKLQLFATTSAANWTWIAITAGLLFGYVLTFYEGLKRVPAVLATAVLMLGPVLSVLLDFAAKGTISGTQIIGCTLALAGAASLLYFSEPLSRSALA